MAKEENKGLSDRELRWQAHLDAYAKANPEKHAAKLAKGEFSTIPDSFV